MQRAESFSDNSSVAIKNSDDELLVMKANEIINEMSKSADNPNAGSADVISQSVKELPDGGKVVTTVKKIGVKVLRRLPDETVIQSKSKFSSKEPVNTVRGYNTPKPGFNGVTKNNQSSDSEQSTAPPMYSKPSQMVRNKVAAATSLYNNRNSVANRLYSATGTTKTSDPARTKLPPIKVDGRPGSPSNILTDANSEQLAKESSVVNSSTISNSGINNASTPMVKSSSNPDIGNDSLASGDKVVTSKDPESTINLTENKDPTKSTEIIEKTKVTAIIEESSNESELASSLASGTSMSDSSLHTTSYRRYGSADSMTKSQPSQLRSTVLTTKQVSNFNKMTDYTTPMNYVGKPHVKHRCPTIHELLALNAEQVLAQKQRRKARAQKNEERRQRNEQRMKENELIDRQRLKYVKDKYYLTVRDEFGDPAYNTEFANMLCLACRPCTLPNPHIITRCEVCYNMNFDDIPLLQ